MTVERLRVLAISADGEASELHYGPEAGWDPDESVPEPPTIDLGRGRIVPVVSGDAPGSVDASSDVSLVSFLLPAGIKLDRYDWLEIETEPLNSAVTYVLSDQIGNTQRGIGFKTLEGSTGIRIPVSACSQWYGYEVDRLYLLADRPADVRAVRLFRSTGGA